MNLGVNSYPPLQNALNLFSLHREVVGMIQTLVAVILVPGNKS